MRGHIDNGIKLEYVSSGLFYSKFSMVSAFANDYIGYIPTPECMKPGVYEARLAMTSRHIADEENIVCEEMAKLH